MPPEQESPLEKLEKRIYQQPTDPDVGVSAYSQAEQAPQYGWKAPAPAVLPKKRMPWTVKFLIATGVFLFIAGVAAAALILFGTRSISSDRVEVKAQAPVSIASGDTVPVVITIHNSNPTALNDATLFVTLPPGTRSGDETGAPLTQYSDALGTVAPGGEATRTIQVKLFGTEGQVLDIPMRVEYHAEGSSALFSAEGSFSVRVATSPISVQVQTLSQSPSGQQFTLTVNVRSNAAAPVENLALTAQYPSGFSMRSASPTPTGSNFFTLGTLAPGEQKTITITGVLVGQKTDQRVFRFIAGSANPDGTSTLSNTYSQGSATVAITNPFLNVNLSLNREVTDPTIVAPGGNVGASLAWQNTLTSTLANASIQVALSGNALNTSSISGGTGFYRSSDTSVVFDRTNNASLASLSAGDNGVGSFSFAAKSAGELAGIKNPTITLVVSVTGQQGSQGQASQVLTSTLTRTVKVGTTVTASSALSRVSGPVPPTVGTETIYTVTLTAKNTVNSVGAAKETFTLPAYVRFTGQADAGVTYNPDTRTVTWTMGDLAPGGTATGKFQIAFMPSASQKGTSPILVEGQTFTGIDRFTGSQVTATAPELTSELSGSETSGTVQ